MGDSVFVKYPRRLKALDFDNFDNSHNSFLWPEYFIDFLCERWIPCQASPSVLCLHYRSVAVQYSTKDAYSSEITFLVKILGIEKSTFVNQALSCLQGEPRRNTLTVSLMKERIKNEWCRDRRTVEFSIHSYFGRMRSSYAQHQNNGVVGGSVDLNIKHC